jgi:ParB/RepB/Spo0J family partition protein
MLQHSIRVEDIQIGERHRALSESDVEWLASSLRDMGLRQPISVRIVEEMEVDGELTAGVPVLVAGRHRLEAAKRLGWSHIDCIEVDDDEITAEMWEIAENLHRLDLTKEQRDQHIRRYAELLEAQENSRQNVAKSKTEANPKGSGRKAGVASQVAKETGLSVRTVQRALSPKPPAEVIPIAARSEQDAVIAQANAIVAAWNRACPEAREIAMNQMDSGPVFDRSRAAR